jgi:beta-phosphoglucomutase-like phosphatase (HAD superfamily)
MILVKPNIRGLIFDCDSTLADTIPIQIEAWIAVFAIQSEHCTEPAQGNERRRRVCMFFIKEHSKYLYQFLNIVRR